ncbi:MAG: CU044_2847 family protein [Egibacteraceae bacterium]
MSNIVSAKVNARGVQPTQPPGATEDGPRRDRVGGGCGGADGGAVGGRGSLVVEVDSLEAGPVKAGRGGQLMGQAAQTLEAALASVVPAASVLLDKLGEVKPSEICVQFGIKLTAEAGAGQLATASADGTVWLWDVASRQPIGEPLTGHAGSVWSVAFRLWALITLLFGRVCPCGQGSARMRAEPWPYAVSWPVASRDVTHCKNLVSQVTFSNLRRGERNPSRSAHIGQTPMLLLPRPLVPMATC